MAVAEALDGDDFNVVHKAEQKALIRPEMERDDAVDAELDRLRTDNCLPHQFGSVMAGHLLRTHEARAAVEQHDVPSADHTFHAAAVHISGTPEAYMAALMEHTPHLHQSQYDTMAQFQREQPESWPR